MTLLKWNMFKRNYKKNRMQITLSFSLDVELLLLFICKCLGFTAISPFLGIKNSGANYILLKPTSKSFLHPLSSHSLCCWCCSCPVSCYSCHHNFVWEWRQSSKVHWMFCCFVCLVFVSLLKHCIMLHAVAGMRNGFPTSHIFHFSI